MASVPSWVGVLAVAGSFVLARWIAPWLMTTLVGGSEFGAPLAETFSTLCIRFAPLVAALVLVVWIAAEISKWINRERLERQSGLETIRELSWAEFELLLCEAFRRQGFDTVEHCGGTRAPDGGVDVRLEKAGAVTLVQCKHWQSARRPVGVKIVRELLGVVTAEGAASGIVVTSGRFTKEAEAFAATTPVRLIDGVELVKMIGAAQRSGRIEGHAKRAASTRGDSRPEVSSPASAAIRPVAAPPLSSNGAPAAAAVDSMVEVKCPECGAAMIRRVAKRGKHAGSEFWGCERYPGCRGRRH